MHSSSFAARRADHCAPSGSSLNAKNRGARRACSNDTAFHVGARAVVGAHPNRPGSRSVSHGAPIAPPLSAPFDVRNSPPESAIGAIKAEKKLAF